MLKFKKSNKKNGFKVVSLLPKNCLAESRCREKPGGPSSIPGFGAIPGCGKAAANRGPKVFGRVSWLCLQDADSQWHVLASWYRFWDPVSIFTFYTVHWHGARAKLRYTTNTPFSCECEDGDSHVGNSVFSKQLTIHSYWTHSFNSVIFWLEKSQGRKEKFPVPSVKKKNPATTEFWLTPMNWQLQPWLVTQS